MSGVGTEIAKQIPWLVKVAAGKKCGCKSFAKELDNNGVEWCREHRAFIVTRLVTQAKLLKVPEVIARRTALAWVDNAILTCQRRSTIEAGILAAGK